jgi:hypothetical protein
MTPGVATRVFGAVLDPGGASPYPEALAAIASDM